jgi:hypothetical protein
MKCLKTNGFHKNTVFDSRFFQAQHPSSEGASSPAPVMEASPSESPVPTEWEVSPERNAGLFGGFLCRA